MALARKQAEERVAQPNPPPEKPRDAERIASYSEVAKRNTTGRPFSIEDKHGEAIKAAQRANLIDRVSKGAVSGVADQDIDMPKKYKTDNDETLALQDELVRRRNLQGSALK